MQNNTNFKRLVIILITAILCLSSIAVVQGALKENLKITNPELLPVIEKTNREYHPTNTGSMAISDAGTWLMGQQDSAGWFPWTPGGSATSNTQGPTGRGLLYAYEVTGDSALLTAAVACGDYMIDIMYQGLGPKPSVYTDGDPRFSTHDPLFLEELTQFTGDSDYADFVQTWFWDKLTSGTYGEANDMDAEEFGDYVVNARNGQGIVALSPWDISATAVAAYIAGETAISDDIMDSILYGLELTTSGDYYDSIGLAGAIWASVETGVDLDPTAGAYTSDDSTTDLANTLITMRTTASPKGWLWCSAADPSDYTNGDTQTTAFALAALAKLDYNTYLSEICGGINFLKALQQTDGQYLIYPGASSTASGSVESHAEAIFGMAVAGRVKNIDTDEVFCGIQAAIDDSDTLDGHTIEVGSGTYYENVVVNKELTVINGSNPIIDAGGISSSSNKYGFRITADNVVVSGFEIINGRGIDSAGIAVPANVRGVTIDSCTIHNCNNGISLYETGSGTVNTIDNNIVYDIYTDVPYGGIGIVVWGDSQGNDDIVVTNNEIYNTARWGIGLGSDWPSDPCENNVISGNYIHDNSHSSSIGIGTINAVYTTISGNIITGNQIGIGPNVNSCDNTIINNEIYQNEMGIGLYGASNNNIIENNNIYSNAWQGILNDGCDNNDIIDNTINGHWAGIHFINSADGNNIENNIVSSNANNIYLDNSHNNIIDSNTLSSPTGWAGIQVDIGSSNNLITDNSISSGTIGVCFYSASNSNTVEYNTFSLNTISIQVSNSNDITIFGNDVLTAGWAGVQFEGSGSGSVHYNNIYGNVIGLNNVGSAVIDATCNWWGDISGPNHWITNPSGTGDTVTDNVIYCPWLDDMYPDGDCSGGAVCWNVDTGEYFCSIQKAIDDADTNDGDTIEVFAGTHPGNIIVYKELTIESQSGAALTIIDANQIDYSVYKNAWGKGINYAWAETNDQGLLKNGFMIWSDYVTIDGFTILNATWPTQYNRGIGILIGSIHTTYAGFIPWNIDQWGGIIPNPDQPTPTGVVIKNNVIDGASDGIYNWASSGNTFEYNTVINSVALGGVGIQCYEGGTNNIIRYNTIDNVDGSGISICGAWPDLLLDVSNTQIYENTVTNNNYGIQFYNVYGSNVDAYNNNILDNNRGVVVEGAGGALVGHANYNNIVGNNIGVQNTAPDGVFDAECNWYGSSLGPTHPSNPIGVGDPVSNNVDFLPWLNLPFENPNSLCEGGACQDLVYVDDDYTTSTPGWYIDHFPTIQVALERLSAYGTAIIYDGIYDEDLVIDDDNCDNTGITIMGAYECFPTDQSAVIKGYATISVDDVTIKYLEFLPTTMGAITVEDGVTGTVLECNKFKRDCVADAIGVQALGDSTVIAELNWWGAPDGPSGGMMDDGKTANGLGVKIIGEVLVEPWIGIHAEIKEPTGTIEIQIGETINFDATGSFAYSFGDCCEPTPLPLQYLWEFGDGSQSSDKIITHTYENTGTYYVSLMIDSPGIAGLYSNFMYDWAYITVHVVTESTPLTANADGNNLGGYETMAGEPLQLFGDAYGGEAEYIWSWNFGDQTSGSNEQNPVHTYTEPGTYTATLTVFSGGETATDTAEVRVYDIDELFVNINDANIIEGEEIMFSASIHGGTPPYTINWDFGDGTTSEETNPTHTYNTQGRYTITITVTDDKAETATDTAIITVDEEITIVEPEITEVKGGFGVKATIDSGDVACDWDITVEGNNVFFGEENSGTIDPNTMETVKLGFSLAFGNVNITVTAEQITKEYTAFAFGPFYLNIKEAV